MESETVADDLEPSPEPAQAPAFVWTGAHVVILVVFCFAQLLEAVDITVVNVALPTIKNDLHFTPNGLQWIVNGYTVVFGGFLLLGGRTGDLLGRRKVFLAGIGAFTLASLLSGLAQDAAGLVAARVLQGLAAAFFVPMTLAMTASIFPDGKVRNRALGIMGATAGVSASLGVTVGGLLASSVGWRWIFFVNIPIGALMLLVGSRFIPAQPPRGRHHQFDVLGAVTATLGTTLLAYTAVQTDTHPWGSARTISLLIASVVLLGYFVVQETRIAREPLVQFSIFRNRAVTGANIVGALVGSGMIAMFYFISLYQQEVLHYSAVKTGVTYLPLTLSLIAFAGLAPLLIPRIGVRWVTVLGCLIAIGGLVLFDRASPTGSAWKDIIGPSLVLGPGMSLTFIPLTIASVAGVTSEQTGLAAGLANVTRTVGGALGLAVIATLAANRTASLLTQGHTQVSALDLGFKYGFVVSAIMLGIAAAAAILLFRGEGRGEKVDISGLSSIGIEE